MKKVKEAIPTRAQLHTKLHAVMESGLTDFIKSTNARRIAVRASIRFAVVSVIFILAIAAFLFMTQIDVTTVFGKIIVMIALLWATVLLISGRSWFTGSTMLVQEIHMALVPILATVLNRTMLYAYNENESGAVAEMLHDSQLLVADVTRLQVKSVYTVFSNFDMRVHEVTFDQKTNSSNGKMTKASALFIDANISSEHAAATMLTTVGSSFGFSYENLRQHMQSNQAFQSIDVTEEKLKAFSTDPVAANDFLTADLLQVMSEWQEDVKVNIRVMRKGTKLYILLPASDENTTYNATSTKPQAIERYASVIARPVWRALMLVEEVQV